MGAFAAASVGVALLAAGCGGPKAKTDKLPLRKDFTDCGAFTANDEVASVSCRNGELRILVSKPEAAPIQLVPFRFDPSADVLTVEGDLRRATGTSIHGLGCLVTAPGKPGRGYLFVIFRGDPKLEGAAAILRLDLSPDQSEQSAQGLRLKRKAASPGRSHRLRAVCENSGSGSVQLAMFVDGKVVVRARDRAMGSFKAAFASVIASSESEVIFDNITADKDRATLASG
jgi:hypothetical protein